MNKKLFALMMVPVIVVMGGTFAFSAWSGSATSVFNESTATFSYTQNITFVHTNANMTPLGVAGANDLTDVTYNTPMQMLDPTTAGSSSAGVVQYANVTNLVPGDYVELYVTIANTGSATLNLSSVSVFNTDGTTLQINTGAGTNNNAQTTNMSNEFLPPASLSAAMAYNNAHPNSLSAYWGTQPGQTTVPQYLTQGQSFTFVMYLMVGSSDTYSHIGFAIEFNIASAV